MKNKEIVSGLGVSCAIITAVSVLYAALIAIVSAVTLIKDDGRVDQWTTWSAILVVFFAWFMSWVSGSLLKASEE